MVGRQLLHYKITRKLGAGGMGEVFEAEDLKLGRTVALKFVLEQIAHDEQAIGRFEREAKAVSRMDHPNVGAVFALEHDGDKTFLAMARYQGETLRERLDSGRLNLRDAMRISLEIARGLEHAHAQGVTHRDVKPANIFLARANGAKLTSPVVVKLLDFGLARLEDASRMMTKPGATTGTLMYMAPEQMRGQTVAHQVDVWAWGAVTFEMLAGRPPFMQDNIGALLAAILSLEPDPLEQLCPEAPLALLNLVKQALRKNPAERIDSASSIVRELETIMAESQARVELAQVELAQVETPIRPDFQSEDFRPEPVASRIPEPVASKVPEKTSSASNHPAFVSGSNGPDTDPPRVEPLKPNVRRPLWLLAPAMLAVIAGAWVVIPKGPKAPECKPASQLSTVLERVLKASGNTLALMDCGTYLHGKGPASLNTYPEALETHREVIALPAGTVMIADAVHYAKARAPLGLMPLPANAKKVENADLSGGQQWRSGDMTVNAMNLTYIQTQAIQTQAIQTNTKNQQLEVSSSDDPNTDFVFLTVYQAGDAPLSNLNVTTNDAHAANFAGVLLNEQTAVFLGPTLQSSAANFDVAVPPGIKIYLISGLEPGSNWKLGFTTDRNWWNITIKPGNDGAVSSEGVVMLETQAPTK
jgi:serine/threonine protein kinase